MPINSGHEYYEELCALAALGELCADEMSVLHKHLETCASCSLEQEHYVRILRCQLPLTDLNRALLPIDTQVEGKGYRERFLARAKKQGFSFTPRLERKPNQFTEIVNFERPWGRVAAVAGTLLVIAAAAAVVQIHRFRDTVKGPPYDTKVLTRLTTPSLITAATSSTSVARVQTAHCDARERQLQRLLVRARTDKTRLQSSLQMSADRIQELSAELQESRSRLEQTTAELHKISAEHGSDAAIISSEEASVADLKKHISSQSDALETEERLLALDRDIRDVMTARSLHIIDVFDVDSGGHFRKPFGRAFYTEGKSLIFYAYDMPSIRNVKNAHSFQAWGYKEPSRQQAQSLGIFYVDDKAQNRWVLKVDDPAVLARIDAVFVTIEPPGGSGKPTGKRLMYAYLNGAPNHP